MREEICAEEPFEGWLPGRDGTEQVGPGAGMALVTPDARGGAQRLRMVGAETLAKRGQHEPTVLAFGEDAEVGQCAQDPVERIGVSTGTMCEVGTGARPIGEQIGQAEFGGNMEQVGGAVAEQQLAQRRHGGWVTGAQGSPPSVTRRADGSGRRRAGQLTPTPKCRPRRVRAGYCLGREGPG